MAVKKETLLEMELAIQEAELELAGLKAAQSSMQRKYDSQAPQVPQVPQVEMANNKTPHFGVPTASQPTLEDRITKLVNEIGDSPFTVSQVTEALGTKSKARVSSLIKKLYDNGKVEFHTRGKGKQPHVYVVSPQKYKE